MEIPKEIELSCISYPDSNDLENIYLLFILEYEMFVVFFFLKYLYK